MTIEMPIVSTSGRPWVDSDRLNRLKFWPIVHPRVEILTEDVTVKILQALDVPEARETFERDGTVIIKGLFQHLEPMMSRIHDDFGAHRFHQRALGGRSNLGWVRIMYHSVIQQVRFAFASFRFASASFRFAFVFASPLLARRLVFTSPLLRHCFHVGLVRLCFHVARLTASLSPLSPRRSLGFAFAFASRPILVASRC